MGAALEVAESITETTTISYSYDPLYRVTGASYSGTLTNTFGYTYDAVGNRLTQNASGTVITSTYDIANRLTNVNGQTYTWDDNGNLLNDGAQTYGYDQANRLKQVVQGAITTTFAYNGAGDRLQQTVNGSPTRYVLDAGAGLTQVLADGTNTYLYGNARLAQYQTSMQYFGADGLGSVRQIYDASAIVVGSTRYDPYGNVMSQGGATSVFAFAGEQYDATGLTYLRARYYSAAQGRFLTRDTWKGDPNAPMSYNAWNYTDSNPVNHTDPTGRFFDESAIPKDAEYSCNCGWIDWTHVGSFSGFSLLDNLKYAADNYRPDKAGTDKWLFYHPVAVHAGPISLDLFNGFALVPNRSLSSGDNIPKLGLSIFMDANEQFEQQQGDVGARLFIPQLQSSWFSEEDLPSDLMGFYGGLQKFSNPNLLPETFKEQIRQVCGVVSKEDSLTVYRDTYKHGALALRGWKNWYPRLVPVPGVCTSGLCVGRRSWPAQFSALTDLRIRPERNGMWWWWIMHPDDVVLPTDRQGVFRLSEHK